MELRVKGTHVITAPIPQILDRLKTELHDRYFKKIDSSGEDNVIVTCPHHKDGQERHPSCYIYSRFDNGTVPYGWVRCFTCGYNVSLPHMVGDLFGADEEFGEKWLLERFGVESACDELSLPEIDLTPAVTKSKPLDERVLKRYEYYHEYMWKRKLHRDVVDRFEVGYDPVTSCITFPVRDIQGNLVMITRRSVATKAFLIDKGIEKPVYLLNEVVNKSYPYCLVTEAQIDALTSWGYGVPACALFGTGSAKQFEILSKSGIRHWVMMFDNDNAGRVAAAKFVHNMPKDVLITDVLIPDGYKDINDLDEESFNKILNNYGLTWRLSGLKN